MNIEIGTVLGLIGIALTIYLAIRKWHPGRVTFIRESSIALFDTIVKNFPEIQVAFEGKAVQPELVLLSGALVNSGRKDISPSMTEIPIKISVPKGFEWLMAKVISTSPDLDAELTIKDGQHLVLTSGLFRQEEFVRFQALARVPLGRETVSLSEKLERSLRFSHRIADTREIDMKKLQDTDELKGIVKRGPRNILYFTFIAIIFAIMLSYVTGYPALLVYSFRLNDNSVVEVKVNPRTNGKLKLEGTKDWYLAYSDIKTFVERSSGPTGVVPRDSLFDRILFALGFPFMLFCFWLSYYLDYRRQKKILKMLDIDS